MGNKNKLTKLEEYAISYAIDEFNTYGPEECKPILINGVKSNYFISSYGRIRGMRKEFIKPTYNTNRYLQVRIWCNRVGYVRKVHRLVAEAFIPNPENKPEVNHIDGNKENNHVKNLEWVTRLENMQHAEKNGLVPHTLGEYHPMSTCSNEQIHRVCRLLESPNNTSKHISEITGVSKAIVDNIRCRNSWTHISSKYNIPKKCIVHTISDRDAVLNIYKSGHFKNITDIAKQVGLPNPTKSGLSFVSRVIKKYGLDKTSTTTESRIEKSKE